MNLLQASEFHTRITIEAGGPGSGRKKEVQRVLKQNGFELKYRTGGGKRGIYKHMYVHPTSNNHIMVHPDGSWEHAKQGSNNKYGKDDKSLQKYLNTNPDTGLKL